MYGHGNARMPADRSLIRLRVRDHSLYLSRGYRVLATQRDGFLDAGPEQGFFVHETRLQLTLDIDADFADPEETKGAREQRGTRTRRWRQEGDDFLLVFDYRAQHAYDVQGNRGTATLHRGLELRIVHTVRRRPATRAGPLSRWSSRRTLSGTHACSGSP